MRILRETPRSSLLVLCFIWAISAQAQTNPEQLMMRGNFCKYIEQTNTVEGNLTVRLNRAEAFLELEQWQACASILASMPPDQAGWRLILLQARLAHKQLQLERATQLFQELNNQYPATTEAGLCSRAWYAQLLFYRERFEQAEQAIQEILPGLEAFPRLRALSWITLANIYQKRSQNGSAEEAFSNARQIWEEKGWTNHPDYAVLLNDYSLLLIQKNQTKEAQQLLQQAEKINERFCQVTSKVAFTLGARALERFQLADYERAEQLNREIVEAFEAIQQSKEIATALTSLGFIYFQIDSLELARVQFEEALNRLDTHFEVGDMRLTRAIATDGLATIMDYLGYPEKADSLYRLEQDILQRIVGKNSMYYSNALNNYAGFLEYAEEFEAAASFYKESAEIVKELFGTTHPAYFNTLYNLARLYTNTDSLDRARQYYQQANATQLRILEHYFAGYDEQTRLEYRLEAMGNFDVFFNYACFQDDPRLAVDVQNLNLATKNLVLDYSLQTRMQDEGQTVDSALLALKDRWLEKRRLLSSAYNYGISDQKKFGLNSVKLEQEVMQLEQQLLERLPSRLAEEQPVTFRQVVDRLDANEAAIDFLTFSYHDGYSFQPDSLFYFALISRKGWDAPKIVYLTNNQELDAVFDAYDHYTRSLTAGYTLYQLIWYPLEKYLEGVNQVHLSPDGLLYKISFDGVYTNPEDEGATLSDRLQIHYYSNLRDFIPQQMELEPISKAVVLGDPRYDHLPEGAISTALNNQAIATVGTFGPLPGTSMELKLIRDQLEKRKIKVTSLEGEEATEAQLLKTLGHNRPGIIHLATHGYFLEYDEAADPEAPIPEERFKSSRNGLMRSGLVLTGVNYSWRGGRLPSDKKDGILTAQEVSDLDLYETRLVVLSACETGRGKITDGEGVFGLQRAFKLAGAKQQLISLWRVPDQQTAAFMGWFYKYLGRKSPYQALKTTQKIMKKKGYPPYYWASFVLF